MNIEELVEQLKDKMDIDLSFSHNTLKVKLTITIDKEMPSGYGFRPENIVIAEDEIDLSDVEPGTRFI